MNIRVIYTKEPLQIVTVEEQENGTVTSFIPSEMGVIIGESDIIRASIISAGLDVVYFDNAVLALRDLYSQK